MMEFYSQGKNCFDFIYKQKSGPYVPSLTLPFLFVLIHVIFVIKNSKSLLALSQFSTKRFDSRKSQMKKCTTKSTTCYEFGSNFNDNDRFEVLHVLPGSYSSEYLLCLYILNQYS